ncbi:MAG: hypothetical protein KAX65_12440, partial [Caldilineaceae bacterium]|nr:hypothetical protein [Caldilineaceae bacterium]
NYLRDDNDLKIYNALLGATETYINEWHLTDTSSERVRVLKGQYNLLLVAVRKLVEDPDLPEFRFIRIWNGAIQMERYKDPNDLGRSTAKDEAPTATNPVAEEAAAQPATPPVPSDLAVAGWELRGTAYGRYYLVNERTQQSTRSCASAEQAFEVARGLARPQQNGDPSAAPDAARSTWAYWEAQGWRLVRDGKANTLAGVHDATTLATPLLISEAGVIHWLSSGGELTEAAYRVAMKQPPSPAAERNARVKAMIETLTAARDLVAEYEKTTGIYSHSNNLKQAVRPMIEMLERNLTDRAAA